MAYLNIQGLNSLWNRISEVFARRAKALGAIVMSGTTLSWANVDGSQMGSVDLNGTFATDAEAAHSLSSTDFTLSLKNVNGTQLSSVSLLAQAKAALNTYFGRKLTWDGDAKRVYLQGQDGTNIDYAYLDNLAKTTYPGRKLTWDAANKYVWLQNKDSEDIDYVNLSSLATTAEVIEEIRQRAIMQVSVTYPSSTTARLSFENYYGAEIDAVTIVIGS